MPFVKQEISKRQRSSCIPDLGLGELKKIKISLPPLELQEQFTHVVLGIEHIRDHQMTSRQEIERLFEGLMARAFTGELN